jgi:ribosomal protein S18 acetylase RimI-like enzyme
MSLIIRRGTMADAAVIVDFNERMALETEGKSLGRAIVSAGVAAALADPARGLYFVAERDGRIVGQLMVTTEWSDWHNGWIWWIQSVYVHPDARRQGVFRALYEHVLAQAQGDPAVAGLRLYVEQENHAAQQTYQRLGMQRTGYLVLERCPL